MDITLLKHQNYYIQSPDVYAHIRWHLLCCGYAAGKTRANVIRCLKSIGELQGKKDYAGDFARIIVAGYTYSHLEKTFLVYFRQYLRESKTAYHDDTKTHIITVGTVKILFLQMLDPGDIFGEDVCQVIVEEADELTEDKMLEATKALTERCRQNVKEYRTPFICMASTAQGQKGLYRLYQKFLSNGTGFILIRGRTQDNIYLPKEYLMDLFSIYNADERKVYMEAQFIRLSAGLVIPGFSWERNFLKKDIIPYIGETVYIGQDFNVGYNRATAWVVRKGICYCIQHFSIVNISDAAKIFRYAYPSQTIKWIPDTTIKERLPAFIKDLKSQGIRVLLKMFNPLVEDSCFQLSKMCELGLVFFCPKAEQAAQSCSLFSRDKLGQIPKGLGPNDPAHDVDTCRYVIVALCQMLTDLKKIHKFMQIRSRNRAPGAQYKPIRHESGYLEFVAEHDNETFEGSV